MINYKACFEELEKLAYQREHSLLKSQVASACLGRAKLAEYPQPYRHTQMSVSGPTQTFQRAKTLGLLGAGAGGAVGGMAGAKFAPGLWKLPAALGGMALGGLAGGGGGAALGARGLRLSRQDAVYAPRAGMR